MDMKNTLLQLLIIGLVVLGVSAFSAEHPELKAFPPAKKGMERFVVVLAHKERGEEDSFKVEIIVGKEMLTDGINLVRLANTIEARPLKGWGYTYYEVTGPSETLSTRMAPPDGASMVKKFVTGSPLQIPYNSRLPIVVYVPKGYEVRYRIWEASEIIKKAEKGQFVATNEAQLITDGPPSSPDGVVKHGGTFTPAMSPYVTWSGEGEIEALFTKLSEDGQILMPLDAYPFSRRQAWVNDRYGVSWQLMLADA